MSFGWVLNRSFLNSLTGDSMRLGDPTQISRQRRKHLRTKPLNSELDTLNPRAIPRTVVPEPVHREDVLLDLAGADSREIHVTLSSPLSFSVNDPSAGEGFAGVKSCVRYSVLV